MCGRKAHTVFRRYAKHMTGYSNQRRMQVTCHENGIIYTPTFDKYTYDGITRKKNNRSHRSSHRNTTGWKSKRLKHQWQVNN